MKSAVVFFSYDGNTRYLAGEISRELDSELLELSVVRQRNATDRETFAWRTRQVLTSPMPEVRFPDFAFHDADLIVVGTPVWAGSMAPAIRSFLRSHDFFRTNFALFACYAGRVGSAIQHMKDMLIGNTIVGELSIREPLQHDREGASHDVTMWARQLFDTLHQPRQKEASL